MAQNSDTKDPIESLSDQLTSWAHQFIDSLAAKTIRPLFVGVRALTVGFFVATISLVILIAGGIGLTRLFDVSVFHGRVWATDLLFGAIFLLVGLLLLRRVNAKGDSDVRH